MLLLTRVSSGRRQVDVGAGHDLWFQVRELRLKPNCTIDNLRVYTGDFLLLETLCSGAEGSSHSIPGDRITAGQVFFHFRSRSPAARLLLQWSRAPSADSGPAASQLVAVETVTTSCTTQASVSATVRGVVSRWREIGMLGGGLMTLCCLAAVAVWWCRRSRCCPPPAPEERCLTSEVETAPEEQYGAH